MGKEGLPIGSRFAERLDDLAHLGGGVATGTGLLAQLGETLRKAGVMADPPVQLPLGRLG